MPELPDITVYVEALQQRTVGQTLERLQVASPFLLRSVDPPIEVAEGRPVRAIFRLGKRIVFGLSDEFYLVFHLMIAGRFQWKARSAKPPARITLATLAFPNGLLILTEAAKKKRASLHVVRGSGALAVHDPGGLEVLDADYATFQERLKRENRTLKRALTDPRLFSGIGNAYSDEILHAARLSPVRLTQQLDESETRRLYNAVRETLAHWTATLRTKFGDRFPGPGEITAFRPGFAVHGRFGKPCPDCRSRVQRIRYAESETNYCPRCQTRGRVLADRSLSRLLKDDWPKNADEWS